MTILVIIIDESVIHIKVSEIESLRFPVFMHFSANIVSNVNTNSIIISFTYMKAFIRISEKLKNRAYMNDSSDAYIIFYLLER